MSSGQVDIRNPERAGRRIIACYKSALIDLELLEGKVLPGQQGASVYCLRV